MHTHPSLPHLEAVDTNHPGINLTMVVVSSTLPHPDRMCKCHGKFLPSGLLSFSYFRSQLQLLNTNSAEMWRSFAVAPLSSLESIIFSNHPLSYPLYINAPRYDYFDLFVRPSSYPFVLVPFIFLLTAFSTGRHAFPRDMDGLYFIYHHCVLSTTFHTH